MKSIFRVLIIPLLFVSCKNETKEKRETKPISYPRHIGDLAKDANYDEDSFVLCNGEENVFQYFNNSGGLEYKGEKPAIIEVFKENYKQELVKKESGMVRVRFIVNCQGKSGRFRALGMTDDYERKEFDSSIVDQLLAITKSLKGWESKIINEIEADYYQYLIFKIKDGQIIDILP